MILTRACLKKAFRELRVPVCGRFYPNEGGVAGYGNRMRAKYTAKWGLQIAEMIFQTRSRACLKKAFRELRVPVCGRFYPNEGGVALRQPNEGKIYRKVGLADCGNDFSDTL